MAPGEGRVAEGCGDTAEVPATAAHPMAIGGDFGAGCN